MKKIKFKYINIFLLCFISGGVTQAVNIIKISKIQAAGTVVFHLKKSVESDVISWKATRYLIDETTGTCTFPTDTATAIGDSVQFSLQKTAGQYTYYKIFAFEGNQLDTLTVQVLNAGIVQKYLYTNPSLSAYPVPVWVVLPPGFSAKSKFIMTMSGIHRNALNMASYWVPFAKANNFIVAAPEFNSENWSRNAYSMGNMFSGSRGGGSLNPKEEWTFNIVEQIHYELYSSCGLIDSTYQLFGFSGGGQFVHRLALFMPDHLISRYIAAGSGWYSCPDIGVAFPWGVRNKFLNVTKEDLISYTNLNLIIIRGTADIVRDNELNKDINSDAQGLNRYRRAEYFYNSGLKINPNLRWKLIDVPAVGHEANKIVIAAGNYIIEN